ncbi:MAG: acyl-CoA dehydrogenase family protein [Myxococcota bacterium]
MTEIGLTPDQIELRKRAREFAHDVLARVEDTIAAHATPRARFEATRPAYEAAIRAGFMRRVIPMPFGGEGTGLVDMAVVAEEFHSVDVNVSLTMFGSLLGLMPIFLGGSEKQHRRWLVPFLAAEGTPLAALANSEPGGSANFDAPKPAEGCRTTARREGEEWVIHGRKQWVSSATGWDGRGPDILTIVCRTDPAKPTAEALSVLAAEGPMQGLTTERDLRGLGHRGHLTPRFRLEGVRVPQENVVGALGAGRELVNGAFTGTAALVGVMSAGVLRAAFDFALGFAKSERRGGPKPIIDHQAVGYLLADVKGALEAVRALSLRACAAADANHPGAAELALHAKVFGSETAVRCLTDLHRVVGIDAYDVDATPLGRHLLDALAFPLFDGGNMGVRRRQLHALLSDPAYDPLHTLPQASPAL